MDIKQGKINEIAIYEDERNNLKIEVEMESDTVWLTQKQMSELFEKNQSTIARHIINILENELDEKSNMQKMHIANSDKLVNFYNLDVIISVGYRVNSKRGIQFRKWATNILKEHLIKGYTINEKKLKDYQQKFIELQKTVGILSRTIENQSVQIEEAKELMKVVSDYSYALQLLDDYDHQRINLKTTTKKTSYELLYDEAIKIVEGMKDEFSSELFGREKDESFKASLGAIYQSAFGEDVYPSIEEKAANLLYFIVKNHSFLDGNKRIAAAVFICFMARNGLMYKANGEKRIADNTLVAMTLMIAESKTTEKDLIVNIIVNLINLNN